MELWWGDCLEEWTMLNLLFLVKKTCTSFVKCIFKYFVILCYFKISFSGLLLVYKNAIHFCTLILYPAILLNSLISSVGFFWWVWFFFFGKCLRISCVHNYMWIKTVLLLPFQIFMSSISSSWLFVLARTFSLVLNRSYVSEYPCLVSNIRGQYPIFHL